MRELYALARPTVYHAHCRSLSLEAARLTTTHPACNHLVRRKAYSERRGGEAGGRIAAAGRGQPNRMLQTSTGALGAGARVLLGIVPLVVLYGLNSPARSVVRLLSPRRRRQAVLPPRHRSHRRTALTISLDGALDRPRPVAQRLRQLARDSR